MRKDKAWWWALGVIALGIYGFVATLQPDAHFGRILSAYGGVFVAGSLAWGMFFDGFRPDRWDIIGSVICFVAVAVDYVLAPWLLIRTYLELSARTLAPGNANLGAR